MRFLLGCQRDKVVFGSTYLLSTAPCNLSLLLFCNLLVLEAQNMSDQLLMWGIQSSHSKVRVSSFVFNSSFHSCLFNHPAINLLYMF